MYCFRTINWGVIIPAVQWNFRHTGQPATKWDREGHRSRIGAQKPPLFSPCLLWPNGPPSQLLLSSSERTNQQQSGIGQTDTCLMAYFCRTSWESWHQKGLMSWECPVNWCVSTLLQKLFKPALPNDAVVSFYIQTQKLVLAVYHLCTNQLNKVDIAARYQVRRVMFVARQLIRRHTFTQPGFFIPVSYPISLIVLHKTQFSLLLPLQRLFFKYFMTLVTTPHHNRFTALFPGPAGWAGARREPLDFMVQGKINRGRHTDHPAERHSIRPRYDL